MIPIRLELQNFLSYRERCTLEFDGIHLACISGLNGAGKSSLLDAMTWALFGKSRSRSDDDLVNRLAARHGEMAEVRLEFDLEGSVYRVIRQKEQGRTSVLEFQLATGDGQWRTMSEGGVRATQAAIETLLRMSFDTFINASFFLQGQADEFTTKTPGKRKEILADLLSVNLWDRYKDAAAERRKKEEEQLLVLDARLQDIERELGEQEAREQAVAEAQLALAAVSERLDTKEQLLQQMRRVEVAVKQQKKQVQDLREALTRAEGRLAKLQQQQAQQQQERERYQAVLGQAETIVAQHSAWQDADATFACWQEKAEAFSQLQQERRPHELALESARSRLRQRQSDLERQQQRVTAMEAEKEQVAQSLAAAEAQLNELSSRLAALREQEDAWHAARAELQQLQGERQLQQQELDRLRQQAEQMEKLAEERATVEQNLQEATAELTRLDEEALAVARKRERHALALAELDGLKAEQERLRESMDKLHERLLKLEDESGGECPLCGQPLSQEHREAVLQEARAQGQQQGNLFRQNKEKIAALTEEVATLTRAIKESTRLDRDLQTQQRRQATAQARLEEIERALQKWQEGGPAQLALLEAALADDTLLQEKEAAVASLAAAAKEKQALEETYRLQQRKHSGAEARLAEIERARQEWYQKGQDELAAVLQRLQESQIAPEAQAALAALDKRIAAVGYDPAAHQEARAARAALDGAAERYQKLKEAQAAVRPLEDGLAHLEQELGEQEETVARLRQQHGEAQTQLQELASDEGDLQPVEKEVFSLREEQVAANRKVGAAQQRLAVLDDLRAQRKEEKEERAALTQLISRLKRLEKACGRDGVQALLIEQALPEIEDDANELLERLTGGEMRVTFETQRELKSRDALAETLDIRISDAVGERPYENYSGGEQFRVNFAIRLALSKILAKRAGARLRTLIIDEGFGSQDPTGRQRLVEAINIIKDDFARILVITHVNELKDAFPMRIEVSKSPAGSEITVI